MAVGSIHIGQSQTAHFKLSFKVFFFILSEDYFLPCLNEEYYATTIYTYMKYTLL